jgi:hypothetical protein
MAQENNAQGAGAEKARGHRRVLQI